MIAQKQESSMTGAEKDHCQTYQTKEELVASQTVDSDLTLGENERRDFQRVMVKSATLETGSAKVRCHLSLHQSALLVKVDAHEQMMVQEQKVSGIADLRQPHGVRVVLKDLKMDQDHQDESFKNVRLSSEPQLQLSRTINGAPRCDLTPLQLNRRFHLVTAARLHPHQPQPMLFQLADPS